MFEWVLQSRGVARFYSWPFCRVLHNTHYGSSRFVSSRTQSGSKSFSSSSSFNATFPPCPFETLGISKDSNMEMVKAAYRVKCQTEHPDIGGSDESFRHINCAYEECSRRLRAQEKMGSSSSSFRAATQSDDGKYQEQSCSWYAFHTARHREERKFFYSEFPRAKTSEEIDELLFVALHSHCFDTIDLSEILALALQNYHLVTGYGAPHLRSCFNAMDRWEDYTERKVGVTLYHILLVLYTDGPKPGLTATIITESVQDVMERMYAKGLEYDDWTMTLAHKAYRTSPYPT